MVGAAGDPKKFMNELRDYREDFLKDYLKLNKNKYRKVSIDVETQES